ncbi:SusC/RagA family TonB-linked outer membrane protein [Leadbetterella byssophila]|uniref:SusC/RagA family TonB-linked outer membrane protein n=1 Tax=Leadbetterella byssophila TaxID=316068 RepID=UPI0039A09256
MKKLLPMLMWCLLIPALLKAQEIEVSGTVTSADDGSPLPGVTVMIKETQKGALTDINGKYTISAPSNSTITLSYIGFKPVSQSVNGRKTIDFKMESDLQALSEVIVTGYHTQNLREVSGSITSIKSKDIAQVPLASFDQALQGRAPGLLVQANSGQPGAAANILIRGKGSVLGSNTPLYIMDGVEITAQDFATLNPSDFESISVLKDAASTAQYGSRGANGVILISSKQGKVGKTKINYDFQTGYSTLPTNKLVLMNSQEKLQYEMDRGNPYGWTEEDLARLRLVDTDWEDVFFRKGKTNAHTLSASGGSGKTTYFTSASIFDQTGTVPNTGLKRYTGRLNVNSSAGDFDFGINSTFGYSDYTNTSEANTGIATPLNAIRWSNPYETPYTETGEYTQMASGQPNALQELLENTNLRNQIKGVGNVFIQYRVPFLKGLVARTSWGGDFRSNENSAYVNPTTYSGGFATGGQGSYGRAYAKQFRYTGTTSLRYTVPMPELHNLSVGVFNEVVKTTSNSFNFTGYGLGGAFNNEAGITPGNSTNGFIPSVGGSGTANALLSYFGDVKYSYKNRYFLELNGRRDGSSRFGDNKKWANFGSVGLSWIVSDEAFFSGLKSTFNELKYKISYGSSGNQAGIGDFQSRELYSRSVYAGVGGLVQSQLANPDLQWERKSVFNTGIELSTFNGRLSVTAEYYNSITSDLFLNQQLSRTTGYSSLVSNIGSLQNSGFEFFVDGDVIRTKSFRWALNASLTANKNKVKSLIGGETEIISGNFINRIGEPMNSLYVVEYAGVNPANGNPLYINSEGVAGEAYSPNFRKIVGTSEVPFFGGFGTAISYKGIAVDAFFSFVSGNKIFNNDRANVENPAYLYDNLSKELTTFWRKEGDITNIPRPGATFRSATTRFVEDGDFLRLRNLNVSYTLPSALVNSWKLSTIRVFAQGQNLFTWTKFLGFDPEMSTTSLTGAQYPALRTITFGLNVGF